MKIKTFETTSQRITKNAETNKDFAIETKIVFHTSDGGYVEDEYKFELDDGKLTIWNDHNDFIGIYDADAVKVLRDFLNEYVKDEA